MPRTKEDYEWTLRKAFHLIWERYRDKASPQTHLSKYVFHNIINTIYFPNLTNYLNRNIITLDLLENIVDDFERLDA